MADLDDFECTVLTDVRRLLGCKSAKSQGFFLSSPSLSKDVLQELQQFP